MINSRRHLNPAAIPVLEELVSATAEAEMLVRLTTLGTANPESLERFAERVGKLEVAWQQADNGQRRRFQHDLENFRRAVAALVEAGERWLLRVGPQLELSARLQKLNLAYCHP